MALSRKIWWFVLAVLFLYVVFHVSARCPPSVQREPAIQTNDTTRREFLQHYAVVVHLLQTIRWLDTDAAREELALSEEQAEAVGERVTEARAAFSGFRAVASERRDARLRDEWLPKAEALESRLARLLTPEQRRRLRQIVWQKQLGAIAMLIPQATEALQLNDEQRREIEDCVAQTLAESDRQGTSALGLWKLAQTAKKARRRAMAVLTPEQQKRWKALLGKPL